MQAQAPTVRTVWASFPLAQTRYVPLSALAQIEIAPGPNQISREDGKRRIVVSANVPGRDLGSFVVEAQQKISEQVKLPAMHWIGWRGQFEQLPSASQPLAIVVPIARLLILVLLFMTLGSTLDALIVFSGVPHVLTAGIAALVLHDIPLSMSAGIGFITPSGAAVLSGLVIVAAIQSLREQGHTLIESVREGALMRLRAVLVTSLVAPLGSSRQPLPPAPVQRFNTRSRPW